MLKYIIPWIWLWTTGFLLPGCKPAVTPYDEQLIQAEARIGEKPDSVYRVLKTIDKSTLSSANLALYHLLWTEAEDKLYIKHTTDSVVTLARTYFEKAADIPHVAKAWYLTARIHSDWEQWEEATQDFLKAKKLMEDSDDYALKGRIINHLGRVYYANRLFSAAQDNYKEAYRCFKQIPDSVSMAYTLQSIGSSFFPQQKPDSILFYYQAALKLAEPTQEERLLCDIYDSLGYIYMDLQQYDKALTCFKKSIQVLTVSTPYSVFADLGKLYTKIGQFDSAKVYLHKALDGPHRATRYMGYRYLAQIAEQEKDLKAALFYKTQQGLLQDSIEQSEKTESVIALQHKHNEQTLTEKSMQSQSQSNWLHGILLIGITGLFILLIAYLYRLIKKDKSQLIRYKKQWKDLVDKIHQNQIQIEKYEEKIQDYQKQLERIADQTGQENKETDSLQLQIKVIQEQNQKLMDQLYNRAIQECHQHPFLKLLYDNEQTQTSFTAAQWKLFDKAFDSIFPGYRKRIVQSFPDLPINYQRICCLVLLDIKVSRMANIMEIQTNSLSVYKNTIKKKYFHCCDNTSLQILLRGLLN